LISAAGVLIIFEAAKNLGNPHPVAKLDYGIILISVTALVNFLVGAVAIRKGRNNNSLALVASGKHLQSDTYSTIGILVGLTLLYFTGLVWIDSAVALVFAFLIVYTGYRIVRDSLSGIMDEADEELLKKMVGLLQANRDENWIDLHNARIIKYGSTLHLDCHLTIPWYFNVHESHTEIDKLNNLVNNHFGESIEMFVHTDGCLDYSCEICDRRECPVRKGVFKSSIEWSVMNISDNHKHKIS
jgi:cation diffusion facilitator family transporter